MPKRLRYIFAVVLCLTSIQSGATHIVGGDFYYNQLSSTRFEIVLELYLDCFNGNPDAIASDKFAIIGVFNASTNAFIDTFEMMRTPPKRVNVVNYVCALPPSTECIDQYTYKKTIAILPGQDGLILAFQRCCRNNTISNIVAPEATGATYWCKIPGSNSLIWNNPARFKSLPPNYLCTTEELVFDHSATDPDGDSLAYELYQPYRGATQMNPRPFSPSNPPFPKVIWQTGYNTFDQMSGNPILKVDRKTGLLTVTPDKEGQFVVGIKVLEFRNGILINETLRDYQMNVYRCQPIITSAFFKRKYECSDTVKFVNLSRNATKYEWTFGNPEDPEATSGERNPSHVYPGNGTYPVKLIAKDDRGCKDTFETTINVLSQIDVEIGPDTNVCKNFTVYLEADYPDATAIRWSNGRIGPRVQATDTGIQTVKVYYESCFGTDTMYIHSRQIALDLPEDSLFCDSVHGLIDAGVENVSYQWSTSPADTFRFLEVHNPGMYSLLIRNETGCTAKDSIYLFNADKPRIGPFLFVCNEFSHTMDAGNIPEAMFLWDNGSTSRFRTVSSAGTYWVQVKQRHCLSADTLKIRNPVIPLELGNDTIYCDSFRVILSAPDHMARYAWNTEATSQSIIVTREGKYSVQVEDTNGCIRMDSIRLEITPSPKIFIGNDTGICVYDEISIGLTDDFTMYEWNTGEQTGTILVSHEAVYVLKVTDKYHCTGTDSIFVYEDPDALPNDMFIPNAFTPNNDGLNDYFPFTDPVTQREFHVQVFNRWGQKVFDSELNGTAHWDALFKDDEVSVDAYVYLIRYRGCDGDLRHESGTVTVLR